VISQSGPDTLVTPSMTIQQNSNETSGFLNSNATSEIEINNQAESVRSSTV
jgi:hypothetical protein